MICHDPHPNPPESRNPELVVTDLDGTLLRSDRTFSLDDLNALNMLGNHKIWRVIATGRSIYSANRVLDPKFPIDYLIFSSGAGVMHWPDKTIIYQQGFSSGTTANLIGILRDLELDFMVHQPIPDNHYFLYHRSGNENPDFERRLAIYEGCSASLAHDPAEMPLFPASQLVAIVDPEQIDTILEQVRDRTDSLANVVLATSPLDGKTFWIELFPPGVSKGGTLRWLADKIQINLKNSIAIGNDFNDVDMLLETGWSFVVDNAPEPLKRQFQVTAGNDHCGFSTAIHSTGSF